jgi:RNA polymerase sigma factor (sigma-70 family)
MTGRGERDVTRRVSEGGDGKAPDAIERPRRGRDSPPRSIDEAETVDPADPESDEHAQTRWARLLAHAALEELRSETNATSYSILEMEFVQGLAPDEIAESLGITVKQVGYRRKRLLRKLRALVAIYEGEPLPRRPK